MFVSIRASSASERLGFERLFSLVWESLVKSSSAVGIEQMLQGCSMEGICRYYLVPACGAVFTDTAPKTIPEQSIRGQRQMLT